MASGGTEGAGGSTQNPIGADPFSMGPDMLGTQLCALALVWAAPWRAASVVMNEALRENIDRMS